MEPLIRPATAADYTPLLEKLIAAFSLEDPLIPPFDTLYPDAIRPDEECMRDWQVAEVDGRIAAALQIVPTALAMGPDIRLNAAGLGQVFCLPEFRGRGLMSALLKASISMMDKRGYEFCWLGGDRFRYRNYGWESAGCTVRIKLAKRRSYGDAPAVPAPGPTAPHRWLGNPAFLTKIVRAHEALPARALRQASAFPAVLSRLGASTWIHEDSSGFAYIVLQGKSIAEYAGSPSTFESLLAYLIDKSSLTVHIPPRPASGPLEGILCAWASSFEAVPCGKVRIFSLERIFRAYKQLLEKRLSEGTWDIGLRVSETCEAIRLSGTSASEMTADFHGPSLELSLPEWSQLLFGPCLPEGLPAEWEDHEFIRRAFPLPLFWPSLSMV